MDLQPRRHPVHPHSLCRPGMRTAKVPAATAELDRPYPEVNLQWCHLPLHDQAGTQQARLVECPGEVAGAVNSDAVPGVYKNTRSNGQEVLPELIFPGHSTALQTCLDSESRDAVVKAQKTHVTGSGLTATPSVQLIDNHTSKTLQLQGPISGDALLSALDLPAPPEQPESSAGFVRGISQ